MSSIPRFGLNYVPSQGWWYSWTDWDESAISRDLNAIAELGVDHIRIHCLWPLFQPNPALVSESMLSHLESLFDVAETHGLDVIVTVFNGWLSGFDFRPSWVADDVNIFTEPATIEAQQRLLSAIAERVGSHPRFLGFDIANEPSVLVGESKNPTAAGQGDDWIRLLLEHCEELVPGALHSVGMDHLPWITPQDAFSRSALATTGAVTAIHAWIFFTGALERYGPTGTGTVHLAEYMLELAKAYHTDPARPVWLQEYGVATEWLHQPLRDEFVASATQASASVDGLWGITWWCSHDIDRGLKGFLDLEYDLGLLTVHNEVKPAGVRFRESIDVIRRTAHGVSLPRHIALELPDDVTPDLAFADHFFSLVDQGTRPAIVLQSRASDPSYLAQRGIQRIERLMEHSRGR